MTVSLYFPKVFPNISIEDIKKYIEMAKIGNVIHINSAPRANNNDGSNCYSVYAHVDWNMNSEYSIYLAKQIVSSSHARLYLSDDKYLVVRQGPAIELFYKDTIPCYDNLFKYKYDEDEYEPYNEDEYEEGYNTY
jgi:hypothetical protein